MATSRGSYQTSRSGTVVDPECQIVYVWARLMMVRVGVGNGVLCGFSRPSGRPRGRQRPCARSFYAFGAVKRSS